MHPPPAAGAVDIFVLFDGQRPAGELPVRYESEDERYALRGRRACLFAFRIRQDLQGRGLGTHLLKTVPASLALHMYRAMGYGRLVLRAREAYQGDEYEYHLYLKQ